MNESKKVYCGIDNDAFGGMTPLGAIVKDAWLFQLIPETETCQNWTHSQLQDLYDKVQKAWDKHGALVSLLPLDLREKHQRIHDKAILRARELGWDADAELQDES